MFQSIRQILHSLELPMGDLNELPTSPHTFKDHSNFRLEIPSINSIEFMESIITESQKHGITINRLTETHGLFTKTSAEIQEMVELANSYGCELYMSVGPRGSYDVSVTAKSEQGKTVAYRLRGQEQLVRAIADIYRGIELGVNAFVIYDEGLLMVLNMMRQRGDIPIHVKFKVSAHCGHGNPASFKLLESLGANSINPTRDLSLSMLAALRQTTHLPIDCHTDTPMSSGGFIRTYEVPEIVRVAAPVYLKVGTSSLKAHGTRPTMAESLGMVKQACIVLEMLDRHYPNATQSPLLRASYV